MRCWQPDLMPASPHAAAATSPPVFPAGPPAAPPADAGTASPSWRGSLLKLVTDWFLIGMVAAVLVASAAPDLGRSGELLHVDTISDWGIFAIFFLNIS